MRARFSSRSHSGSRLPRLNLVAPLQAPSTAKEDLLVAQQRLSLALEKAQKGIEQALLHLAVQKVYGQAYEYQKCTRDNGKVMANRLDYANQFVFEVVGEKGTYSKVIELSDGTKLGERNIHLNLRESPSSYWDALKNGFACTSQWKDYQELKKRYRAIARKYKQVDDFTKSIMEAVGDGEAVVSDRLPFDPEMEREIMLQNSSEA